MCISSASAHYFLINVHGLILVLQNEKCMHTVYYRLLIYIYRYIIVLILLVNNKPYKKNITYFSESTFKSRLKFPAVTHLN